MHLFIKINLFQALKNKTTQPIAAIKMTSGEDPIFYRPAIILKI